MKIHYIAQYADGKSALSNRKYSLAGVAKMNYIIYCIKELKCDYEVYATSQITKNKYSGIKKYNNIIYRASFASKNIYQFYFDRLFAIIQLFIYLLTIERDDTVIVYHERWYSLWVKIAKRLKNWNLIYEVEELYCAVGERTQNHIHNEIESLKITNKYILSTVTLAKTLSMSNEANYAVCNGVYMPVFKHDKIVTEKKIHLLYSGSLNKSKGVIQTIYSVENLSENFVLHICGKGSKKECDQVVDTINQLNCNCDIIFEGCLSNEDYFNLMKICSIGLCLANPTAAFPSKIIEYLRNGLSVISIKKDEIASADCSKMIVFIDEVSAKTVTQAIENILNSNLSINNYDDLYRLHSNFIKNLKSLI